MCQWKFLVLRYSANVSARSSFKAPEMSFVAFDARSVGVFNGALARSSRPLRSAMSISFSIWHCRLAWTHIGRLLAHAEKSLLLRPDLRSLRRNTVFLSRPPDRAQL